MSPLHSLPKLPRCSSGRGYDIDGEVTLKFYRLQKISEDSIDLDQWEDDPLKGPTEVGNQRPEDKEVALSQLIDKLNDRFGTNNNLSITLVQNPSGQNGASDVVP